MAKNNNNLLLLKSDQDNVKYNLMFQLNVLLVCKLRIYFPIFGYAYVLLEIRTVACYVFIVQFLIASLSL